MCQPSCRRPSSSCQALVPPPQRGRPGPAKVEIWPRSLFVETSVGDLSAHLEDNWKGGIGSIFHHIDNRVVEGVLVLLQPVGQVVVDGARIVDNRKVGILVGASWKNFQFSCCQEKTKKDDLFGVSCNEDLCREEISRSQYLCLISVSIVRHFEFENWYGQGSPGFGFWKVGLLPRWFAFSFSSNVLSVACHWIVTITLIVRWRWSCVQCEGRPLEIEIPPPGCWALPSVSQTCRCNSEEPQFIIKDY